MSWRARAALPWLLLALSLLLFLATVWLGSSSAFLTAFLGYVAVGAVVAARRPAHPVGWLLCAIGSFGQ